MPQLRPALALALLASAALSAACAADAPVAPTSSAGLRPRAGVRSVDPAVTDAQDPADSAADARVAARTVSGPASRRALLYAPFADSTDGSLGRIRAALRRMGYRVTLATGAAATTARLRGDSLAGYGVVYVRTIGAAAARIGTPPGLNVGDGPSPTTGAVLLTGEGVPQDLTLAPADAGHLSWTLGGVLAGVDTLHALGWLASRPADEGALAQALGLTQGPAFGVSSAFVRATHTRRLPQSLVVLDAGVAGDAGARGLFGGGDGFQGLVGIAAAGGWTRPPRATFAALHAERFFDALADGAELAEARAAAATASLAAWRDRGEGVDATTDPTAFRLQRDGLAPGALYVRPADSVHFDVELSDESGAPLPSGIDPTALAVGDRVRVTATPYLDGQPATARRATVLPQAAAAVSTTASGWRLDALGPVRFTASVVGGVRREPDPVLAVARHSRRVAGPPAWTYAPALASLRPTLAAGQVVSLVPTGRTVSGGRHPLPVGEVAFTSSDSTVLRVEPVGTPQKGWAVRALRAGQATLTGTATTSGESAQQELTITAGPAYSAFRLEGAPSVVPFVSPDPALRPRVAFHVSAYETALGARRDVSELLDWSVEGAALAFGAPDAPPNEADVRASGRVTVRARLGGVVVASRSVLVDACPTAIASPSNASGRVGTTLAVRAAATHALTRTPCDPRLVTARPPVTLRFDSLATPASGAMPEPVYFFTVLSASRTSLAFVGAGSTRRTVSVLTTR